MQRRPAHRRPRRGRHRWRRSVAVVVPSSSDYRYVTPSTVSEATPGRSAAPTRTPTKSRTCAGTSASRNRPRRHRRQTTRAATTSTQLLTDRVARAIEIPASQMYPYGPAPADRRAIQRPPGHRRPRRGRHRWRRRVAVVLPSSYDYRYVTPSTVSDNNTGEIGRAHRNAAHISDLCRYERQPK